MTLSAYLYVLAPACHTRHARDRRRSTPCTWPRARCGTRLATCPEWDARSGTAVSLGEVDGNLLRNGVLGDCLQAAVFAAQQVHDDLHTGGVVVAVREGHDDFGVDFGKVTGRKLARSSSVRTR